MRLSPNLGVRIATTECVDTTIYLPMKPETFVKLFEEMVDIKIQLQLAVSLKLSPELSKVLAEKREVDRRRLEQIRTELIQFLS